MTCRSHLTEVTAMHAMLSANQVKDLKSLLRMWKIYFINSEKKTVLLYIVREIFTIRKENSSVIISLNYGFEYCDCKATDKGSLKKHAKYIHNGVEYSCEYCDYKVTEKGSLQRHLKSVHDGVKYSCEYCDYKAT